MLARFKPAVPTPRPSEDHEARVEVLEDLAALMGFAVQAGPLADGTRPDVCRFDPTTNGVFIGEAKATESPRSAATRNRFINYLKRLAASRASICWSVCAVCFRNQHDIPEWDRFLRLTLKQAALSARPIRFERLDTRFGLVWATFRPPHPLAPTRRAKMPSVFCPPPGQGRSPARAPTLESR